MLDQLFLAEIVEIQLPRNKSQTINLGTISTPILTVSGTFWGTSWGKLCFGSLPLFGEYMVLKCVRGPFFTPTLRSFGGSMRPACCVCAAVVAVAKSWNNAATNDLYTTFPTHRTYTSWYVSTCHLRWHISLRPFCGLHILWNVSKYVQNCHTRRSIKNNSDICGALWEHEKPCWETKPVCCSKYTN